MSVKNLYIVFILIFTLVSCNNSNSKKELVPEQKSKPVNHSKTRNNIIDLSPKAKKLTENWIEYQNINEYIQQYKEISITNSLLNAKHLAELTQLLKDSIRVEKLDNSSVKIRLNVLNTEALRLADMSTINQITEEEVILENKNILNAYSALNIKINNIVSQENLNIQLKAFIDEVTKKKVVSDTLPNIVDSIQQ